MQLVISGQANIIYLDLVAKASGNAITSGDVDFYLIAKSGANVGKWFRTSDNSWQATEASAGVAAHKANGHWLLSVDSEAWTTGLTFIMYAKESGSLQIDYSEEIVCDRLITAEEVKTAIEQAGSVLEALQKLQRADKVIDTSGDPWICDYKEEGTEDVLMSKTLKNTAGENITNTNNVLGKLIKEI